MTKLGLEAPADGHVSPFNRVTGITEKITFRWERAFDATEYQLAIAQDEEFKVLIASITAASDDSPVVLFVGPQAEGTAQVNLSMGTTYYWRVQITQPYFRISSEHRTFQVESLEVTPPVIIERPPPPVISVPPTTAMPPPRRSPPAWT